MLGTVWRSVAARTTVRAHVESAGRVRRGAKSQAHVLPRRERFVLMTIRSVSRRTAASDASPSPAHARTCQSPRVRGKDLHLIFFNKRKKDKKNICSIVNANLRLDSCTRAQRAGSSRTWVSGLSALILSCRGASIVVPEVHVATPWFLAARIHRIQRSCRFCRGHSADQARDRQT